MTDKKSDDLKETESGHYLNNLATAVNGLFGIGKKDDMRSKTELDEITEDNGEKKNRNDLRAPGTKSNLHVLSKDPTQVKKETVIVDDAVIFGEVLSTSNMFIAGSIKGAVSSEGDIVVTGKIYGNIKGNSITIKDGLVEGNILAKLDVILMGTDATVVGDVEANNFFSEGKIKGNVKTLYSVALKNQAVLLGNITTKSVNIQDGVILDGNVKIMSDISIENLFKDLSGRRTDVLQVRDDE